MVNVVVTLCIIKYQKAENKIEKKKQKLVEDVIIVIRDLILRDSCALLALDYDFFK